MDMRMKVDSVSVPAARQSPVAQETSVRAGKKYL
jgi:hypothetical protein